MSEYHVLAAETLIGDDADKFVRSELGRTLLGIAAQEREVALQALTGCDPEDTRRIRALQNDIWRAEHFQEWLMELIRRGEQALKVMEHDEEYPNE